MLWVCKVFAHRITDFADFTVFASESRITQMTQINADKIPASTSIAKDTLVRYMAISDRYLIRVHLCHPCNPRFRGFRSESRMTRITQMNADKTAAINRIAEITLIRCNYDFRQVSFQRNPGNAI